MRATLFYRRLPSPLHATRPGIGALWALALSVAALVLYHPLVLLALALAVLGAGVGAGVSRELARALRTALIVALPIVTINVLVAREGLTVFARLGDLGPFGQGDLTVEALVYGAVIALKLTVVILVSTLASLTIDPDELLRVLRRLSFRSALTASLATRMVPLLAADAQRLAEAQRTRPPSARPRTRPPSGRPVRSPIRLDPRTGGARGRVALLGAVLGGSLDRAMDVAATLELRGYATAAGARDHGGRGRHGAHRRSAWRARYRGRAGRPRRPWSRHDLAFAASALALVALALGGRLSGAASFEAYPLLQMRLDAGTLALCVALLLAALLPLCDRRGIEP